MSSQESEAVTYSMRENICKPCIQQGADSSNKYKKLEQLNSKKTTQTMNKEFEHILKKKKIANGKNAQSC